MGLKDNKLYQAAYWKAFEDFFGKQNSAVVKAMMLAKNPKADTGTAEIDRVCFGLRQTMGWLAEAIEKRALSSLGHEERDLPGAPKSGLLLDGEARSHLVVRLLDRDIRLQ